MASNSKKRQTMAKITRERAVKEKRALKQEKKEARKQAAADARNGITVEGTLGEDAAEGDTDQATVATDELVDPTRSD